MNKDYSEYQLSNAEKHDLLRRGNKNLRYAYFINHAKFMEYDKTIHLSVDSTNEYEFMKEDLDEYERFELEKLGINPTVFNDEELAEMEEHRIDSLSKNKKWFDFLSSKYDIDKDTFMTEQFYRLNPDLKEGPLNNVLSGSTVKLSYGEGVLDFIYADFKTLTVKKLMFYKSFRTIMEQVVPQPSSDKLERQPEKIYSDSQQIVDNYFKFCYTMSSIDEIAYQSLYSAICPPLFYSQFDLYDGLSYYYTYLDNLQKEYAELIEFCFDETFYPRLLGELYPSERYAIYKGIHDLSALSVRRETVSFSSHTMSGNTMPYGMPAEEFISRISQRSKPTESHIELANKYNIEPEMLATIIKMPYFISTQYEFSTISEILDLELTKMFEANIRFRKCKRCGKYFIMKGNYNTNYCDRIAEGETRSCQDISAQENYKNKIADNKAIPVYSKYYKRYSARVKVRQIKESDFKKWKYEALTKRDECSDGKITLEDYITWMEDSFPNRKGKN